MRGAIAAAAPHDEAVRVLGPAEAPLALVRGRHRFRILAKSPRGFDLSAYLRDWLAKAPKNEGQHQARGRRRPAELLVIIKDASAGAPMSRDITIRQAIASDLDGVRRVLVETWHDTYDALMGAENVTALTDRWHAIDVLASQLNAHNCSFLVAETEGRIVGHAFVSQRPEVLMLRRIYVLPSHQRLGIGERLLGAALARHPQSTLVRLNVEAENAKGLSFYRRHGFAVVGEAIEEGVKVVAMEKPLVPKG